MHKLNMQIIIATVLGVLIGAGLHQLPVDSSLRSQGIYLAGLVGSLFVDLLKMILVPLIFTSICVGVANLQQHRQAQRVWKITMLFFVSSMSLAMLLALVASNIFKPGADMPLALFSEAMQNYQAKNTAPTDFLVQVAHSLFVNPFAAFAEANVLAILIFALFLGSALVATGAQAQPLINLLEIFLSLIMRIVSWIMQLAPLGIAALLIKLVATQNLELLGTLLKFIILIFTTTLIHGVITLPAILWIFTGKSPLWFWRGARPALLTAFATSSSNATIPVTLRCCDENLGVKKSVSGFVVPLGATVNMDGSALYEAAAALFVANLAGIDLSFTQQFIVFCTAMIASMGAPGIPSAGMVTMILVLQSVGLPTEALAILLPIDRLLDTIRTAVNVEGDLIGSVLVQHYTHDDIA